MLSTIDLGLLIKKDIADNGPMPISKFMSYALNHYTNSYYKSLDPIGTIGDFITAPEISQLFGEIIGIWCVNYWKIEKKPQKVKLIELGPGKGTLMSDLLRATKKQRKNETRGHIAFIPTTYKNMPKIIEALNG